MFDTMAAADGVGLAANQVGVPLRLFVFDCPDDEGVVHRGCVLNPRLEVAQAGPAGPVRTTTRVACRCPASSSRPAARTGRG